ncbi:MAG: hypothetical protein AAF950_08235 [Pseudomonadota bacterium]
MSNHDDGTPVPKIKENTHDDMTWLTGKTADGVDLCSYREHLKDIELTDKEADELLAILWNIMSHFVDLGFGVDAISLIEHLSDPEPCGQEPAICRAESADVVE